MKHVDGTSRRASPHDVAQACQIMLDGLYRFGGHLGGFMSGSLLNIHEKHPDFASKLFDTGQLD